MTQHPPLHYALVAVLLRIVNLDDARWDIQLLAMRLAGVLMTVLAVPFIAGGVRVLTGSRPLALVAACVPLFIPQFQHISGSVTNDALLTLTGAATTYLLIRVVGGDLSYRTAVLAGIALGAGLLTKAFMLLAAPIVVLGFLVARAPRSSFPARMGRAAVCGVVAMAVGGWWWIRNIVVYGALQPAGQTRVPTVDPGRTLEVYVRRAASALSQSFWAQFGWLEITIASPFVALATALALTLVVLGVVSARRRWREALLLATFAASVVLVVSYNGLTAFRESGQFPGLQGRYFYVALGALASLAALGVGLLIRRSDRAALRVLPFAVLGGLLTTGLGLWVAFQGFYRAPGEPLDTAAERWLAWSPADPVHVVVVVAVLALAASALLAWSAVLAVRGAGPPRSASAASA